MPNGFSSEVIPRSSKLTVCVGSRGQRSWVIRGHQGHITVEALYNVSLFSELKMLTTEKLNLEEFLVKSSVFH